MKFSNFGPLVGSAWPRARVPTLLLGALVALALWVGGHPPEADLAVRAAVGRWAADPDWRWVAAVAEPLTGLGDRFVAIPLTLAVGLVRSLRSCSRRPLIALGTAVLALSGTVLPMKALIARGGPGTAAAAPGGGYFPSGHTATALACYVALAMALTAGGSARARRTGVWTAAALAAMIGAALVWQNYHWLTDVVGGYALAGLLIWVLFVWPLRLLPVPAVGVRPEQLAAGSVADPPSASVAEAGRR